MHPSNIVRVGVVCTPWWRFSQGSRYRGSGPGSTMTGTGNTNLGSGTSAAAAPVKAA